MITAWDSSLHTDSPRGIAIDSRSRILIIDAGTVFRFEVHFICIMPLIDGYNLHNEPIMVLVYGIQES